MILGGVKATRSWSVRLQSLIHLHVAALIDLLLLLLVVLLLSLKVLCLLLQVALNQSMGRV